MKIENNNIQPLSNIKSKNKLSKKDTVDVNILLNRVRSEKNIEVKKNLIIAAGALGALAVTGLITIL